MFAKTKIVVVSALALGTASAALAATKKSVHHRQAAVVHQVPASAYQSFGSARAQEPANIYIQDQDFKNQF
jgi:hypothetical protein